MIDTIDTIDTAEFKTASKVVSMVALGIDTIGTGHRHQVLVVHHDRATGPAPGQGHCSAALGQTRPRPIR